MIPADPDAIEPRELDDPLDCYIDALQAFDRALDGLAEWVGIYGPTATIERQVSHE